MADLKSTSNQKLDVKPDSKKFASQTDRQICGIVRPISSSGADYPITHWREVHDIVSDALDPVGFDLRLISESDSAGVILSEIVGNLYNDKIVVCDVSSKSPNVMFELGLRMAFEKPVIIIADDETDFSFDISPVKHLIYPKSLRFSLMVDFKEKLALSAVSTLQKSQSDGYRGYLQQFGPIHVTNLEPQQIAFDSLAEELVDIKRSIQSLRATSNREQPPETIRKTVRYYSNRLDADEAANAEAAIDDIPGFIAHSTRLRSGAFRIRVENYDADLEDGKIRDETQLAEVVKNLGLTS